MAKKLDPRLLEILQRYGENPEEALWDCHGTWVAYHKAIERIAARAAIAFDMPQVIEARSDAKIVAIAVQGKMGERTEWSFGEAAPSNNKNAYPYAMAEKRAKDRVVLKLVGLHGLVYSEEESDDFKPQPAAPQQAKREEAFPLRPGWERQPNDPPYKSSSQLKKDGSFGWFEDELYQTKTLLALNKSEPGWSARARQEGWPVSWKHAACDRIEGREKAIMEEMERLSEASPEELAHLPVRDALEHSVYDNPLGAG